MSEQAEQNAKNAEALKLLLEALQVPVKIANQTIGSIYWLAMLNIASGAWIAFATYQSLDDNASASIFVFIVIVVPSFMLSKLYFTLNEVINLPSKIVRFFQASSQKMSEAYQAQAKFRKMLKDADWRIDSLIKDQQWQASDLITATRTAGSGLSLWKRFRNFFALARRLRDAKAILGEFEGLATLTAGAMLLANPIFLALVTLSIVVTLLWTLIAIIVFMLHIR